MAKKIDIITIHRNCNYGSVLQTYATQIIFNNLGIDVEVIDYVREQDTISGSLKRLKNKSQKLNNPLILLMAQIVMFPSYIKKKIVFDHFLNTYINLTKKKYNTNEQLKNNLPDADAFCTGSDQIWNSVWNEGVIPAYFLDFVPNGVGKFSYASSIGKENIDGKEMGIICSLLKKYDCISVREKNSIEILNRMGIDDVIQVLDPTLFLPAVFWERIASNKYKGKKYIVTYNLHHDKRLDAFAQELSKEKGIRIINISYNWHDVIRKGKTAWCPSVIEYLGLIRDAEYVIADSFHATVFSIHFHKKFCVFYPEQSSIRIRDLLDLTGLKECGVEKGEERRFIDNSIDYKKVEETLKNYRVKDNIFLQRIMHTINRDTGANNAESICI